MQLSLRLSAIADMVTEGNRLVDVGCDHGYLPVYLVQNGKVPAAIAMDVRKGPLSRAQEHIRQYGLEEYIKTRLSDGLGALEAGEGDTLVIAGMGGPLMERILTDGASVRDSFSELILQPQSDIPHFRRFIQNEGWEIVEENMIEEEGKIYPMMRVQKAQMPLIEKRKSDLPYSLEEAFGKFLLDSGNLVLLQYLKRELRIREEILEKLEKAATAAERMAQVKEEKQLILAAMAKYESK